MHAEIWGLGVVMYDKIYILVGPRVEIELGLKKRSSIIDQQSLLSSSIKSASYTSSPSNNNHNQSRKAPIIITVSKTTLPMTSHHTTSVAARDLPPSLHHSAVSPNSNVDDDISLGYPSMPRRHRTSSSSSSLSHLPRFTKSPTMSTTDSSGSDTSRLRITAAVPRTKTSLTSAEVGVGEFTKPRVNERSRRKATRCQGGHGEDFRYYGRHSNQWLFNDFSVTRAVRKGWGRVFGKEQKGDWFERRQ